MRRILYFFLFGLFITEALYARDDFTILQQNDSFIQFSFSPQQWQRQDVAINGKSYTRFYFADASVKSRPGEPEIPVRTFVFAVPGGSKVTATVIASQFREIENVALLPVPFWSDEEVPRSIYPDTVQLENHSRWFPQNIIELEKPAYAGDLRIVRLHISPLQYLFSKRKVRQFTQVEIRLQFSNVQSMKNPVMPAVMQNREDIFSRILANPRQAKKWRRKNRLIPALRKTHSFYSTSDYYKIPVEKDGLYRITGKFLQDNGIDLSTLIPSTIKIFNNGGRVLPRGLTTPRPDSLIENAILVADGGDGRFDADNYILFYGVGVNGWEYSADEGKYSHYINPYTFKNIYWLTFNDNRTGKRMSAASVPATTVRTLTTYREMAYIDDDIINIHRSGMVWFGFQFTDQTRSYSTPLELKNLVQANDILLRARFYSTHGNPHQFKINFDGQQIASASFYGTRVYDLNSEKQISISQSNHTIDIDYTPSSQTSVAYLDWLEVFARAQLALQNNALTFFGEIADEAVEYQVEGASASDYTILDVTDCADVRRFQDFTVQGSRISFKANLTGDRPKKFAVIGNDQIRSVTGMTKDELSTLRDTGDKADFIIITHNDFYNAAHSLKNLRESHDDLSTIVVKIDDIFDEFSCGLLDPTAIRDFLKYAYEHWAQRPRYVLLFGDGDYDYKNIKSSNDSNWIPPFETYYLDEISSRTTDDWFTYIEGDDSQMDLSIGRIPVQTTEEAGFVVDKLVQYATEPEPGYWKNLYTIVADDEVTNQSKSETIHTKDAEDLAEHYIPKRFDLDKIYLTEYPVVLDAAVSWISKPAVTEDLLNRINEGSLIINFIGHGNPHLWTHERIFKDSRDANRIQNGRRYAFWITATCDFGRWDDPEDQSFAEKILMMENRGSVSMLASSRLVYASSNAVFNKQFTRILLQNTGRSLRVGDAIRLAKSATYTVSNNEKFAILGDPTLKLEVPALNVKVTRLFPDSLKALSKITVNGKIYDHFQNPVTISGDIYLRTFDSRREVTYQPVAGNAISYILPGNPIFRGKGTVQTGEFELQFIVPKDISYGGKSGRISIFFENETIAGTGYKDNLIVDGTATDLIDAQGPDIDFTAQNQNLVDFAVLNENEILEIELKDDKSGINITGDVGHKIMAIPDDQSLSRKEITHLFEYDQNSFLHGKIRMPLTLFSQFTTAESPGEMHRLAIKAWDNANNSSTKLIQFEIVPDGKLVLKDLLNYPNPFYQTTTFTFFLNTEAEVSVKIYTSAGRLIRRMNHIPGSFGFNMVSWSGHDQDGDPVANGVYLYKVQARHEDQSVEQIGKLIKLE